MTADRFSSRELFSWKDTGWQMDPGCYSTSWRKGMNTFISGLGPAEYEVHEISQEVVRNLGVRTYETYPLLCNRFPFIIILHSLLFRVHGVELVAKIRASFCIIVIFIRR